jgi:hypothetical protein
VTYHDVLPKKLNILFPENTDYDCRTGKKPILIVSGLAIGYRLIIKGSVSKPTKTLRKWSLKGRCNSKLMEASTGVTYIAYEVQPKETLIVCQNFRDESRGFYRLIHSLRLELK